MDVIKNPMILERSFKHECRKPIVYVSRDCKFMNFFYSIIKQVDSTILGLYEFKVIYLHFNHSSAMLSYDGNCIDIKVKADDERRETETLFELNGEEGKKRNNWHSLMDYVSNLQSFGFAKIIDPYNSPFHCFGHFAGCSISVAGFRDLQHIVRIYCEDEEPLLAAYKQLFMAGLRCNPHPT
ncbi:MAG: hypothetical protein V1837_03235 [Candidatus Woesearchaeota archaeon]